MSCKKWYMGTNTKMYKTIAQTNQFIGRLSELTADIDRSGWELFVIPSFTTLDSANQHRDKNLVKLGAQNMGWEEQGQFTGEISPLMLQEVGCDLVMIGHSERRHVFMETDEMENRKVRCGLEHGFTVLLCIGETEAEKEAGQSDEVLNRQIEAGFAGVAQENADRIWVAYEPVWAIGVNGKPVEIDYADRKLTVIRESLVKRFGPQGEDVPIFYGGSVNAENAEPLASCKDINGLFIGRSAWDADRFFAIIRKVQAVRQKIN
ncbi:triose-phosphate isomerase [Oscillibacter sp.]|uniref:triose-phosphate isomerase n=1 Tax=Oscillibacter sp. TaxID=1945593 RepID=UPI0033960BEA